MTFRVQWAILLTIVGVLSAGIALAATGSWGWAIAALLGSGVLARAIASPLTARRDHR